MPHASVLKSHISYKMKIALFSDVHANLPAFNALLNDLDEKRPDAIYCLGDLIGYHVWPNEVIAQLRSRNISTIAGNHDLKIKKETDGTGKDFAYHIVNEENKSFLKALPAHIRLEYQFGGKLMTILLVHGSPRSNDEYTLEDLDESYVRGMLYEAKADILFCGHSHKPYHRIIAAQDAGSVYHIINTGSVGKPKDGNPKGGYVMLTLDEHSNLTDSGSINVEFVRFGYDVETAAKAIEDSPLPDEFADRLRKAY